MDRGEEPKGPDYKPIPRPRKHDQGLSDTDHILDDVFTLHAEADIEVIQNIENDEKLKAIRSKSYETALENESLDVSIPENQYHYNENEYLPMGMGLLANVSKSQVKPKPVPKPRPSKSQSVDNLSSKPSNSCVQEKSNQVKIVPIQLAPSPPSKEKPLSDSDAIDRASYNTQKELPRPKSTTWYDTDSSIKQSTDSEESSVAISHKVNPRDDVKLPTRKEKHSSFQFGSQILDTLKSLTGNSTKQNKAEKSDVLQRDRKSRFYCNISDDTEDKVAVEESEVVPPVLSPRNKPPFDVRPNQLPPPRLPGLVMSSLHGATSDLTNQDVPPLPPPRNKRKSKNAIEYPVSDFKPGTLNLMEEIDQKLKDLNMGTEDNRICDIVRSGKDVVDHDSCVNTKDSKSYKCDPSSGSNHALINKQPTEEHICINRDVSHNLNIKKLDDSRNEHNDIFNQRCDFVHKNTLQIDSEHFNELDVLIPPAGYSQPKVDHDNQFLLLTTSSSDTLPVSRAPDLPDKIVSREHLPQSQSKRASLRENRNSDLDIVVYEDHSDSSDSEYYGGYIEPEVIGFDNDTIKSSSNHSNVSDFLSVETPAPALPPRSNSASPALLNKFPSPSKSFDSKHEYNQNNCDNSLNSLNATTNLSDYMHDSDSMDSSSTLTSSMNAPLSACAIDNLSSSGSVKATENNTNDLFVDKTGEKTKNSIMTAVTDYKIKVKQTDSKVHMPISCDSSSQLDTFIPVEDDETKEFEETLKPNIDLKILPIQTSTISSDSSSSSEDNLYEVPDSPEDNYSISFNRNSDTNASFSSNNSSNYGTSPVLSPVKLRRRLLTHESSSESDTSSRPASWASFSSGASDYVPGPWFNSGQRISQSLSWDVLHSGSPDVSLSSARSSISSLDHSENEDDDKDKVSKQDTKRQKKLFYVAKEMMTSERSFVDILKLLNEDFRSVIAKSSQAIKTPVVPPNILSQILRHLPELQKFNESLLHDLTDRINNWQKNPKIADVFVKKGPFLKLYTAYIMDFENKSAIFDEARKKYFEFDKCTTFFEASSRCHKLSLHHFLLKPVQRLPQYRLLLTDYQKYLTKDSPDYEDAKAALAIVTEVAEHANQSMKYGENLNKLMQIQNSLVGTYEVIRPGRYLIKEGELLKLSRKEMQPRYFFLLNDVLLYTTPYTASYSAKQYRLNNALPLLGMKVDVPNKEGYQNEFSIISTQRSFTVCTTTPEDKDEWLKVLRSAIGENSDKRKSFVYTTMQAQGIPIPPAKTRTKSVKPNTIANLGKQHPIWIPDSRVSMCMLCTGEFTLAFRRHHCRACGKVVCAFCSDFKAPLEYLNNKPGRVCKDCFGRLRRAARGSLSTTDEEKVKETKQLLSQFTKSSHGLKSKLVKLTESHMHRVSQIRETFGMGSWTKPQALKEVSATDAYSATNGYLKVWKDKKWNKKWFVLKGKVLYGFKGSEDTAASESTVLLGYEVRPFLTVIREITNVMVQKFQRNNVVLDENHLSGVPAQQIFELVHKGLPNMMFATETPESKEKWMKLLRQATIP